MEDRFLTGMVLEGTYRIVRRVGEGGMGVVYEATHARLAGRYAVKVLHPDVAKHADALARFRREAEITSALRHPGIVQVIDFNMPVDGPPFLVMEYLDGVDLGEVIARDGPFPLARATEITTQIASALAAAHRKGIVHRDLKPQNIFLLPADGDDPERVKILDFGVSKIRSLSRKITGGDMLLGTPQYMAPEQAEGRVAQIDETADQFSLAAIVYEMLTGQSAFTGETLASIAYQVVHATPTPIARHRPDLPQGIQRVIGRGLAKEKEDRFASVSAFAAHFRQSGDATAEAEIRRMERTRDVPAARPSWDDDARTTIVDPRLSRALARVRDIRTPAPWATPRWALLAGVALTCLVAGATVAVRGHRPHHPAPGPRLPAAVARSTGPTVEPLVLPPAPAPAPESGHGLPSVAAAAEFDLASDPPGVPLWIDGEPFPTLNEQMLTRARGTLRPGAHKFEVMAPGFEPWRHVADLKPGAVTRLRARLKRLEPSEEPIREQTADPAPTCRGKTPLAEDICSMTVGSSPWAELWIDGRDSARHTPVVDLRTSCGRHQLAFKRADLGIDHVVDVTLTCDRQLRKSFRLSPAD